MQHHSPVYPTSRDVALFRYIGVRGYVTSQAIHSRFWLGRREQTCQARLRQLVTGHYLHTHVITMHKQAQYIYSLGRKTGLLFSEAERNQFIQGRIAPREIPHLLLTGTVLDKLQATYHVAGFTHERALKAAQGKQASGALADARVMLNGQDYLIEIDSIHYTGQRLSKKTTSLGQAGYPVLWIVTSTARLRSVSQAAHNQQNIQVISLDSL